MQRKATEERCHENPFRHPDVKPDWAQLTRLGGDRVAILFEELRRRVGVIDGLVEDLHFVGPEDGWVPRYSVNGETVAFTHIGPGRLEATLHVAGCPAGASQRAVPPAPLPGSAMRRLTDDEHSNALLRAELRTHAAVEAFARMLIRTCKRPKRPKLA